MCCLLVKTVQVSKITLININSSEKLIEFLNEVKGKLGNSFIEFSIRTIFWDVPQWNRRPTIGYRGSIKLISFQRINFPSISK